MGAAIPPSNYDASTGKFAARTDVPETEEALGPLLEAWWNRGNALYKEDKLDEAQAYYERCLQGYETIHGQNHPMALSTRQNLGTLLWKKNQLHDAKSLYERVVSGREITLGPDHPNTISSVQNLAMLLKAMGGPKELMQAETLFRRALDSYERIYGLTHNSTLSVVNALGVLCEQQGRLEESQKYLERSLLGREGTLGKNHIKTLLVAQNLAHLYMKMPGTDQRRLALALYQRCYNLYLAEFGVDHPDTVQLKRHLAQCGCLKLDSSLRGTSSNSGRIT